MAIDVQTLFMRMDANGVTTILLPGLLFFAFVFGILTSTNVFGKNKGVQMIISLVVAILAVRVTVVQQFVLEIFGRAGIAIAVLLIVVILTAMFVPDESRGPWYYTMMGIGGLAFIFVLFNTFSSFNWLNSGWWGEWGSTLVVGAAVIALVIVMAVTSGDSSSGGGGGGGTVSITPHR